MRRRARPFTALAAVVALVAGGTVVLADGGGGERHAAQPRAPQASDARVAPRPGSVRIEARASDPGGAAPWAVRAWVTRGRRVACAQVGRLVNGTFGAVRPDGRFERLSYADSPTCSRETLTRQAPLLVSETFLDDALAREPRALRTVVWGLAGSDARRATLTLPDGTRRLALSRRGGFLSVHDGTLRTHAPVVRVRYAGGRLRVASERLRRGRLVQPAQDLSVATRAPDPSGGPDWALVTRGGAGCAHEARVIANGRAGHLTRRGTFHDVLVAGRSGCPAPPLDRSRPLATGYSWGVDRPVVVNGYAWTGVERIVAEGLGERRELEPSNGRYLLVYREGASGELVLTAELEGGGTFRDEIPVGSLPSRPPRSAFRYAGGPTLAVGRDGVVTVPIDCPRTRSSRKCMGTVRLVGRTPDGRRLQLGWAFVRVGAGTSGRPIRVRLTRRARTLLARRGRLAATLMVLTGDHSPRRRRVTLVAAPRRASAPVAVRPAEPGRRATVTVRFPLVAAIDDARDIYVARLTGPGGTDCRQRMSLRGGGTWHPRYNARHRRNGVRVGFLPTRDEPRHPNVGAPDPPAVRDVDRRSWCPGRYRVAVWFEDVREGCRSDCAPRRRFVGEATFRVR